MSVSVPEAVAVLSRTITRVMAKRYTDEVGPWRAYLRILS